MRLMTMMMTMMMFLRIALHQTPVALFLDFVFQVGAKNFLPQIPFVKLKLAGQMEVLGRTMKLLEYELRKKR